MTSRLVITLGIASFSLTAMADVQSYYCPQNHGYINLGMSQEQVMAACGEPMSRQQANQPVMQKVPVQQLIYNNQGSQKVFYGVWAIPTGYSTGATLEVDIVDNKVKSVRVNGSNTNAFSICGGTGIEVGDPSSKVYGSCGSPTMTNNTYINQPIQSHARPEVWIYQPGEYQSPISLTFVNGKLQSIQ